MTDQTTHASIQDEVLSFLLESPSPQRIIEFHASEAAQNRLRYLLDANREGILSEAEREELEEASHMNLFIMRLKAEARHQLKGA
jgi:hypothetical protein